MKTKKNLNKLIGMTEEKAEEYLERNEMIMRVMRREGENLMGTMEMRPYRVNVSVCDGKVDEIFNIG